MTILRSAICVLIALSLAACGGSSSSPQAPPADRAAATATQSGTLTLSFANASSSSATQRSAKFVSSAALSASVSVNGGTATIFDIGPTSSLCTGLTARVCSLSLTIPVGQNNSVAVTLYDGANGTGHSLGSGSNSVNVVQGMPFTVTVGLNPAIASIASVTGVTAFTNGTASSVTASITFKDPAGVVITGSGSVPNFAQPVTFQSSSSHITFSPPGLTTPGQTVTISYDGSASAPVTATLSVFVGTTLLQAVPITIGAASNPISTFTIPTASSSPFGITTGPDGALWFVENAANKIGTISTVTGAFHEYSILTASSNAACIVTGSDNNLWFAENANIGRITTAGVVSEFATPGATPQCLTSGPDGNLWFTTASSGIGRMTTSGVPTLFTAPFDLQGITKGPDGALWFVDRSNNKVGRMTTAGVVTGEYAAPTPNSFLYQIASGSDGNLWVTEDTLGGRILRVTPSGVVTEFTTPVTGDTFGIAPGSDNNIYIGTGSQTMAFNPSTQTGTAITGATLYSGSAFYVTNGPDNAIWFTDNTHNQIGRIQLP